MKKETVEEKQEMKVEEKIEKVEKVEKEEKEEKVTMMKQTEVKEQDMPKKTDDLNIFDDDDEEITIKREPRRSRRTFFLSLY